MTFNALNKGGNMVVVRHGGEGTWRERKKETTRWSHDTVLTFKILLKFFATRRDGHMG
jgi:hypothetical protein